MSAFPPHKSIPSIPVNQTIALKYLQEYLSLTSSTPYLLPNAKLEPTGPTIGSSHSSVTIHNLERVEAGLRGEWLAPTLELRRKMLWKSRRTDGKIRKSLKESRSIDEGDLGARVQNVKTKQVDSDLEAEPSAKNVPDFTQAPAGELSRKEKDARKAEKKARHKAEQRAKELKKKSTA
ncbi:hypothetical protein DID88_008808 [Monilinia fructigena]|uniref:Uncharacterized protein n=1 Tax=Monilinia fructigena TaxID=38457 RepID=A0A395J6L6_9HELO|nr:hypothetical protein DID88_008808 [Monilinia fructigena]